MDHLESPLGNTKYGPDSIYSINIGAFNLTAPVSKNFFGNNNIYENLFLQQFTKNACSKMKIF